MMSAQTSQPHWPYSIRPAEKADLDRLVELLLALQDHLEAANPGLWRMREESRANLKGKIASRLDAANSLTLVAEHEQYGVVGLISGRIATNNHYDPPLAGLVDQAFVRQDHRRRAVASRLVAELCRFFAANGVEDLSLRYVVGNDEAEAFWSALGFTPRILTAGARRSEIQARLP
jgi:GNAT superfamily N-acetyltransferase